MKLTILAVTLILILGTFGGLVAVSGSSDDFGLIPEINEDDVFESDRSAEEYLQQQTGDILVSAYPIIEYSTGWYESGDGKADILNMVVVRKEGTSGSGNQVRISAHGKVHIGGSPFKIIATERSANRVVYSLVGSKNDLERGDMILQKVKTYNNGISRWDGTLTIQNMNRVNEVLSADVKVMTRENVVNEGKIKNYSGGQDKVSYYGKWNLGTSFFKFVSEKSNAKKINAEAYGERVRGKIELELMSENNGVRVYEGKLKLDETKDDELNPSTEKDKLSAVLRVEVKYDGQDWVGPVKATLKDGSVLEGYMTMGEITTNRNVPVTDVPKDLRGRDWEDDSFDDSDNRGFDVDERSDSSISDDSFDDSRSDDLFDDDSNKPKKKGFWKKFVRAFGFKDSE